MTETPTHSLRATHWRIQLESKPSSMLVDGNDLESVINTAEAMGAKIVGLLTTKRNGLWEVKMSWRDA